MNTLFKGWMTFLSLGLLLGVYSVFRIFTVGHGELANTTQLLPWGLQVSTYIYLALTSTGCSFVSYVGSLAGVERLKPIVPRAVVLSLLTILAGFGSLGLEIGRLERLAIEFIVNPNLTSPIWWMGVFYTLKIFTLIFEVLLMKFHNERVELVLNWFGLFVGIAAVSALGGVFGVLEPRSYGFGALTPIYFLIMAFLGGVSLVLFVSSIISMLKRGTDEPLNGAIGILRTAFIISVGIVFLASVWRYIVGVWVVSPSYDLFKIWSEKFWLFSVAMGMLVPLIIAVSTRTTLGMAVTSFIVLVVQLIDRNNLIVGIQKISLFQGVWEPPILPYTPAPIEIMVVVAAFSFIGFIYTIVERKGILEEYQH